VLDDGWRGERVVDLPMDVLFGKAPRMHRAATAMAPGVYAPLALDTIALRDAALDVLRHPSVGSKSYLVTIGDRTVGGLCARDQMVGPWQVPVADCAVTLLDFDGYAGEAMAIGERTPLALLSSPAAARMAVGEAITNLAAAPIAALVEVRLSANWMAAVSHPGEDAALFAAVRAVGLDLCPALGISIPVGKDSLSMQARWKHDGIDERVVSPVSLVVSAFARVTDARRALTPELRAGGDTTLLLVDLGERRDRLGGSILAQVHGTLAATPPDVDAPALLKGLFDAVQALNADGLLLAYHDRSDGGLVATLAEMAFAGHCGLEITLDGWAGEPLAALFNEELGAVLQVRADEVARVRTVLTQHGIDDCTHAIGHPRDDDRIRITRNDTVLAQWSRTEMIAAWHETSHAMQRLRDDPDCADSEREQVLDDADPGLHARLAFDLEDDVAAPYINTGKRPRVAILREQGVNGQVEMAVAFMRAGFDAYDVHMSDLIEGRVDLSTHDGVVACGGFSYGDVLGAGRGWATSIRHRESLAETFRTFLADTRHFALGVCNGCQMFAGLKSLVPGAEHWPTLERNRSEQYEARLALVEVLPSPSLFLAGMAGSRLPIAVAHGEGRAQFASDTAREQAKACLRFVDRRGNATERFPDNANGSPGGLTGFCNDDGRVTILMPHPERVIRSVQMSWRPREWGEHSPWMRMFRNARVWLG
jgi:phosphoribosylformylglycinamidine synthase